MLSSSAKRQKLDNKEEQERPPSRQDKATQTHPAPALKDMAIQTDDQDGIDQSVNQEEATLSLFLEKIKTSIVDKIANQEPPLIFISYAWKPDTDRLAQDKHNQRVTRLVKILEAVGFNVIYDRNDLSGNISTWMKVGVGAANKVIVIGTPELYTKVTEGKKSSDKKPNVLIEFEAALRKKDEDVFPVIFEGDWHSFPEEMRNRMAMDCSTEEKFLPGLLSAENPLGLLPALLNLRPSGAKDQTLRLAYANAWKELQTKLFALQSPKPQKTNMLLHAQSTSHLIPQGTTLSQWQRQLAIVPGSSTTANSSSNTALNPLNRRRSF